MMAGDRSYGVFFHYTSHPYPIRKGMLTIFEAEGEFTIKQKEGKRVEIFDCSQFASFAQMPLSYTATQFNIPFVKDDPRKDLHLKFDVSTDLLLVYSRMLPLFEKAGKPPTMQPFKTKEMLQSCSSSGNSSSSIRDEWSSDNNTSSPDALHDVKRRRITGQPNQQTSTSLPVRISSQVLTISSSSVANNITPSSVTLPVSSLSANIISPTLSNMNRGTPLNKSVMSGDRSYEVQFRYNNHGHLLRRGTLTVFEAEEQFTIMPKDGKKVEIFHCSQFELFGHRPINNTATQFDIPFVKKDPRGNLHLKFASAGDLQIVYNRLLCLFEKAGKSAAKRLYKAKGMLQSSSSSGNSSFLIRDEWNSDNYTSGPDALHDVKRRRITPAQLNQQTSTSLPVRSSSQVLTVLSSSAANNITPSSVTLPVSSHSANIMSPTLCNVNTGTPLNKSVISVNRSFEVQFRYSKLGDLLRRGTLTVFEAEGQFTIVSKEGEEVETYDCSQFEFFARMPVSNTATMFDIPFVKKDPRGNLHLKFRDSAELRVAYNGLLCLFEKAGKSAANRLYMAKGLLQSSSSSGNSSFLKKGNAHIFDKQLRILQDEWNSDHYVRSPGPQHVVKRKSITFSQSNQETSTSSTACRNIQEGFPTRSPKIRQINVETNIKFAPVKNGKRLSGAEFLEQVNSVMKLEEADHNITKNVLDSILPEYDNLINESQEWKDKYQQLLDDTEDMKRLGTKQTKYAKVSAIQGFCKDIEVADTLPAVNSITTDELKTADKKLKDLHDGVSRTKKVLMKTFSKYGRVSADPIDDKSDPNLPEAVLQIPGTQSSDVPAGHTKQVSKSNCNLM